MTRNKTLLIFHLVICSLSTSEGKIEQQIITEYVKEITTANEQRSLILIYRNISAFENFPQSFYNLELPLYNIYLEELENFNGEFNEGYDIRTTYEESKLYFIFIHNLEDDLPLIRKIYFWRDRDKIVVFINGNYSRSQLKASFLYCYQFYIVNIVFAFLTDKVETFSYNPFIQDYYLRMSNPGNLFPDKFQNLHGYRLRISMFPSVINTLVKGKYHGRDGQMSRTIAHHLNATYIYIHPKITKLAPVINQYDDVAERITDVGFNTRYIKFNFKNLIEKTYPHDRDDLAILIPKEEGLKKFTGLHSLLSDSVWSLSLAISLLFFFYVVASIMVEGRKLDFINLLMMILKLLLNKPVKATNKFDFKLALSSYMILCFFLSTLIVCRLTSIFTAPAHFHGIETLKEFAETDYKILTIDRFQELLNASLISNLRKKILPRLALIEEDDYLEEMKKCKSVVFICKDHLANYALIQKENYPKGVQFYRVMEERIMPTLSCYIVSYGSPFLERIDNLVRRLVESGIHDYWKMKTWQKINIRNVHNSKRKSHRDAISVSDIWTGIQVLIFGFGTSVFVFVLELLSTKLRKCSK